MSPSFKFYGIGFEVVQMQPSPPFLHSCGLRVYYQYCGIVLLYVCNTLRIFIYPTSLSTPVGYCPSSCASYQFQQTRHMMVITSLFFGVLVQATPQKRTPPSKSPKRIITTRPNLSPHFSPWEQIWISRTLGPFNIFMVTERSSSVASSGYLGSASRRHRKKRIAYDVSLRLGFVAVYLPL